MAGNIAAALTADTRVARAETAISTEIDGELVALDVARGVCYGLNRIGTRIWQLIEVPRSAREIVETLLVEYDVSPEVCMEQTVSLLGDLLSAQLAIAAPLPATADQANLQAGV